MIVSIWSYIMGILEQEGAFELSPHARWYYRGDMGTGWDSEKGILEGEGGGIRS